MNDPVDGVLARLRRGIRNVPDYPAPGILFRDITPLLADPHLLADAVRELAASAAIDPPAGAASDPPAGAIDHSANGAIELVAGIEARGFILAPPVALALGAGFVPIRKRGKLPHATAAVEYTLEYGTAVLEIHLDAVRAGQRVLIVDDVLATGGTAEAAVNLVESRGAQVVGLSFLIELSALSGRERLRNLPVRSLIRY